MGSAAPTPEPTPDPLSPVVIGGLFGDEPPARSFRRLDEFFALGGTTIDTAHLYADGRAQRVIGRWLAANGNPGQIVAKVCHPVGADPRVRPEVIVSETEESLRRLGVDHVDVVQLHRDDPAVPVPDLVAALAGLVERGLTRAVGVSNWPAGRLARFAALCPTRPVVSYQFSLARPRRELWPGALAADGRILRVVDEHAMCLLSWTAMARGWFAGREPADLAGVRRRLLAAFDTPANRAARAVVDALAAERGVPPQVLALAWLFTGPRDVHAVVGPDSDAQLRECFAAARLALTPQESAALAAVSGREPGPEPKPAPGPATLD